MTGQAIIDQRNGALRHAIDALPPSQPYDCYRPIRVPGRCDGLTLGECLLTIFPEVEPDHWNLRFARGYILRNGQPVDQHCLVRGGNEFQHRFPNWVEPEVNRNVRICWEDDAIIAVDKPAPLPMHPSGRFNQNTLTWLLSRVYDTKHLRVVHRLDANTSGIVIMARSSQAATDLRQQFQQHRVRKQYVVRVHGRPDADQFTCDQPIATRPGTGGIRDIDPKGRLAATDFNVVQRFDDGTTLVSACPHTGRTNQIRIHLWSLGFPVLGDPSYMPNGEFERGGTLSVTEPPMCLHAAAIEFDHPIWQTRLQLQSSPPRWTGAS